MAKKAKARKTSTARPRPSNGPVRKEMKSLSGELKKIIAAGRDKKGTLTSPQLKKAKKTKKALDDALAAIRQCIQLHSAY